MAAGTVTLNQDDVHKKTRRIQATFVGGDGSLVVSVDRTKSITLQSTGTFDSGDLAIQKSNDGTNFAALATAITHTVAAMSAVATADLGFAFYKLDISTGGASQNVVATLMINE